MSDFAEVIIASGAQSILEQNAPAPEAPEDVTEGAKFVVPMLVPEGVESGDGRIIKKDALTLRDLPIPILWQMQTGDGHSGSVIVGRLDSVERLDGGLGNAKGVFDTGAWGREAERLVRGGFLRGISVDLDLFEASPVEMSADEEDAQETRNVISQPKLQIDKARVIAATLVAKPAFQEAFVQIVPDTLTEDEQVDDAVVASATVIDGVKMDLATAPDFPPAAWFQAPDVSRPTPINVTPEGRVFGHIAAWDQSHIGLPNNVKPPKSRSNYAYFTTGSIQTEEGSDIAVGNLTLSGGHAPLNADAMSAIKHYDDTASAVADVAVGEDAFGIWVAGAVRPGTTVAQVRALKASAPSGDWRPIKGRLELVAVCQVNVPGFPIPRSSTITASGADQVYALVAAGADYMAAVREQDHAEDLAHKKELALENIDKILAEDRAKAQREIDKEFAIRRMEMFL